MAFLAITLLFLFNKVDELREEECYSTYGGIPVRTSYSDGGVTSCFYNTGTGIVEKRVMNVDGVNRRLE